jgi:hypothetical protein
MQRKAFEPTGLVPRSIIRTFGRFRQQLLPGAETIAIQEFRISRYQILVSIKCLFSLIVIPLVVNYSVKTILLAPLTRYLWNSQQEEIFLNSYQEDRAFLEMHDFSEKLFFDYLTEESHRPFFQECDGSAKNNNTPSYLITLKTSPSTPSKVNSFPIGSHCPPFSSPKVSPNESYKDFSNFHKSLGGERYSTLQNLEYSSDQIQQELQLKTLELATYYNQQSILAITNLLGDFFTFITVIILFIVMKPQIIILKSFLTESIYSLSDTTKSFLLILGMDLLVGFHSPRGWEISLETLLRHFGLPENEDFVLLFVAIFPVFLDTVFKYWIFRYLNKISPSTVVTYHSMLE